MHFWFRETYGGLHLKHNVIPDIAMFGKAMGNGYAITAVVEKEYMSFAQQTFISSTFDRRIGPTAGIATLKEMERLRSWEKITKNGKYLKKCIKKIADKNQIKIEFTGLDALINFKFEDEKHEIFTKFITNEMLKKGFLAKNSIYVSVAHSDLLIKKYLYHLENIFSKLRKLEINQIKEII